MADCVVRVYSWQTLAFFSHFVFLCMRVHGKMTNKVILILIVKCGLGKMTKKVILILNVWHVTA